MTGADNHGQRALVTGASAGIGQQLARGLDNLRDLARELTTEQTETQECRLQQ